VRRSGFAFGLATLLLAGAPDGTPASKAEELAPVKIEGDLIPRPLTAEPGDAARGREIAFNRERGNCIVCHVIPAPDDRTHGDVGPSLRGVAARLSEGQMRLRLADGRRLNPASLMPSYHRVDGLTRVARQYAGKPALTAQEIEDVLAYLMTLR
jgi:sulfur-oxidizing protein SoxX